MNILEEIYNYKLDFVRRAKILRSLDELIDQSNFDKGYEKEFNKNRLINIYTIFIGSYDICIRIKIIIININVIFL